MLSQKIHEHKLDAPERDVDIRRIISAKPSLRMWYSEIYRSARDSLSRCPKEPERTSWAFESRGPLSDANTALAWIVFRRDLAKFRELFPSLDLISYRPHSPLRYWLTGGLKAWTLLPEALFALGTQIDNGLLGRVAGFRELCKYRNSTALTLRESDAELVAGAIPK